MSDLTTKQAAAIAALLEGNNQAGAATAAGVTKRTLQRWLTDPTFTTALREGSDGAIRAASARLAALAEHAVTSIAVTMQQPTTPGAGVRLRAADALLGHALRIREHADILERLAQLEKMLDEPGK
jgi:hypothetical protein